MIRFFILIAPLLCGLAASAVARASEDSLSPAVLRDTLARDVRLSCNDLPALRSAALRGALSVLYQHNEHEALWQDAQRLAALKAELGRLADDGLEPTEYDFAMRAGPSAEHCAELRISSQYLLALEHLSLGRLAQEDHEPSWRADTLPPSSVSALSELAITGLRDGMDTAFEQARPALPQYRDLRAAYAGMDRNRPSPPAVPTGPLLRPGMDDERIDLITRRLQQDGFLSEQRIPAQHYDETLVQAVSRFQTSRGLQADGIIGPRTVRAMNLSPARLVQQVRINLERLRWINAQRSDYLLLINVASGHLQLLRANEPVWQARAQTGRPGRPTPSLVSHINRVTLNPGWTVPPTILREDMLPRIRQDPGYLDENNIQTLDARGNSLDPQGIDWSNPRGIVLRQPPGPDNPLGQIVFRLPNPFSIYLHDTPSQNLFQPADRNVSSGCVRVENAKGLADELFAGFNASQRERIAGRMASGETHEVALTDGPRVILAYWTAFADAAGRLNFVPDSYGLDEALGVALQDEQTNPRADSAEVAMRTEAASTGLVSEEGATCQMDP